MGADHPPPAPAYQPPRATLVGLVATMLVVVAPHWRHLPLGVILLSVGLAGWWSHRVWREGRLPQFSPTTRNLLLVLGLLVVLVRPHGISGRDAGVALLCMMLFLKLLEFRSHRDPLLVILLGFFVTITHFFYSQGFLMGAIMVVTALALTASLVAFGSWESRAFGPRQVVRLAGTMLLQALPLMVLLFLLFPRLPGPLWGLSQEGMGGRGITGLGDTMTPGSVSHLVKSGAVAFRVRFQGDPPPRRTLYWRGPTLWMLGTTTWRPWYATGWRPPVERELLGGEVHYQVTLEPHQQNWLPVLDTPAILPEGSRLSRDLQPELDKPVNKLLRYHASSFTGYRLGVWLTPEEEQMGLQLPRRARKPGNGPGFNPRTMALAARWLDEGLSPRQLVQRVLTLFREQPFFYTLNPPLMQDQRIDRFLFQERRGFCEHYAEAFTVLMRAAGVPARVVLGYQGGEVNPISGDMVVRQSDAHAWAEVWLEGAGWVRVDPTAAVAPERIESGSAEALESRGELPLILVREQGALRWLHQGWDAFNSYWDDWVVGFNQQRQRRFLSGLGWQELSWGAIGMGLTGAVMGLFAALGWWMLVHQRHPRREPLLRCYDTFCQRLARVGVARHAPEGPLDFAQRAVSALPAHAPEIQRITRLYLALRYARRPPPGGLRLLRHLVKRFRP